MYVRPPLCWLGTALSVPCYCRIDVLCEVVVPNELRVVEVRVVGGKEEDARKKKFVISAVALYSSQYSITTPSTECSCLQLLRRVWSMAKVYQYLTCLGLQQQGVGYAP
jgi:hypothetical protein